jgi:asparagine synthase (glutamine-hydrolysing)
LLFGFLAKYPQFELEKSSLSEDSFCQHYRQLIWHMDEPFARQSAYVRWEVAHLAHRHQRKVLLNGEGADEVLGGYLTFAPRFLNDLWKHGHYLRLGRELWATFHHPERDRIVATWRGIRAQQRSRSNEPSAGARALQRKFEINVQPMPDAYRACEDLKDFLHDWVHRSSLPRLLVCNDKMAMANSVEGRAPFLDHEFVDLAFSMDTRQLVVDGLRKFPLRDAMRGLVPDEIMFRRSKDAFHAPVFEYLRNESIQRRVRQMFAEPHTAKAFSPQAYLTEYARFLSRQGADSLFLLHGLFLEEWARMFEVAFD